MDRLRSAILQSRVLDTRQEIDELLQRESAIHAVLATFYDCATHFEGFPPAAMHPLVVVYNLDRLLVDLERFEVLPDIIRYVGKHLASAPTSQQTILEAPASSQTGELSEMVAGQEVEAVATHLLALEQSRTEVKARTDLLELLLAHPDVLVETLVFVNAFMHGFERVGRKARSALVRLAARYLVHHLRGVDTTPKPDGAPPPIPGDRSTDIFLDALRTFNSPTALASLEALMSAGQEQEVLAVLLIRAEENSGERQRNLIFADAARETVGNLSTGKRRELLNHLTRRLLVRRRGEPLIEDLNRKTREQPLDSRRARTLEKDLEDALFRCDPRAAIDLARDLLVSEEGADRVRQCLFRTATTCTEDTTAQTLGILATCLASARHHGWPAGRSSLLRAVFALAGERVGC